MRILSDKRGRVRGLVPTRLYFLVSVIIRIGKIIKITGIYYPLVEFLFIYLHDFSSRKR